MEAFNTYDQDTLRRAMIKQRDDDALHIINQGLWPPPWVNDEFIIQQDEARLLSAIADNFGIPWRDSVPAICNQAMSALNMKAKGNAKAAIKRCFALGYIKARYNPEEAIHYLDLTPLGRAMLDLWEDEQSNITDANS